MVPNCAMPRHCGLRKGRQRRRSPRQWLFGIAIAAAACGQPNPKIIDASEPTQRSVRPQDHLSEDAKVGMLIAAVRKSELTFVQDEIERPGSAAADKLQLLLDRDIDGVRDVREFISTIAAPERAEEQDIVLLGHEQTMLAREWFYRRLAKIEGISYEASPAVAAAELAQAERSGKRMRILDALMIVERSEATFVVPGRRAIPMPKVGGVGKKKRRFKKKKRGPKSRRYTGPEFADMLRKKWEFLGADIDELEPFIKEIASDSFASLAPYQVHLADGSQEPFEGWLRARLDDKARRIAHGG
ncbi:MAG: DUF5329 family protein [Nannocystaceae bacterium]|nr:DUF5329 family protein [Nannocystaceae bacterium]